MTQQMVNLLLCSYNLIKAKVLNIILFDRVKPQYESFPDGSVLNEFAVKYDSHKVWIVLGAGQLVTSHIPKTSKTGFF